MKEHVSIVDLLVVVLVVVDVVVVFVLVLVGHATTLFLQLNMCSPARSAAFLQSALTATHSLFLSFNFCSYSIIFLHLLDSFLEALASLELGRSLSQSLSHSVTQSQMF